MSGKVRVLWKEWVVASATDYEIGRFNTKVEAVACMRRQMKGGLYIDRIETLEACDQYGDHIRVRFSE